MMVQRLAAAGGVVVAVAVAVVAAGDIKKTKTAPKMGGDGAVSNSFQTSTPVNCNLG